MTADWLDWASSGAAVAAVLVAFYAVWAGYRNQRRLDDREHRRENYAQYVVGMSNVLDTLKELEESFQEYWAALKRAAPTSGPTTPPASTLDIVSRLPLQVKVWVQSTLAGVPVDSTRLKSDLVRLGLPEEGQFVMDAMTSLLLRLSDHGSRVQTSAAILSLSGTPQELLNAINAIADAIPLEIEKISTPPGKPGDWAGVQKRLDEIKRLMKNDINR